MAIELPPLPYAHRPAAAHFRRNPRLPLRQAPQDLRRQPEQADRGHRVRRHAAGRDHQDVLGRHVQQRRADLEPHLLLELPGAKRRRSSQPAQLAEAINAAFGSFDKFKEEFTKTSIGTFGSGWGWLVQRADGSLALASTIQRRHPADQRRHPAADLRRVGTRLLHRLPQRASEVRRSVLEPGQLGLRG